MTDAEYGYIVCLKKDGTEGISCPLQADATELKIGRATHCDIRMNIEEVSRLHARIFVDQNGSVFAENLSKSGSTFVSGNRVEQPVQLKSRDVVEIEGRKFVFYTLSEYQFAHAATPAKKVAATPMSAKKATPAKPMQEQQQPQQQPSTNIESSAPVAESTKLNNNNKLNTPLRVAIQSFSFASNNEKHVAATDVPVQQQVPAPVVAEPVVENVPEQQPVSRMLPTPIRNAIRKRRRSVSEVPAQDQPVLDAAPVEMASETFEAVANVEVEQAVVTVCESVEAVVIATESPAHIRVKIPTPIRNRLASTSKKPRPNLARRQFVVRSSTKKIHAMPRMVLHEELPSVVEDATMEPVVCIPAEEQGATPGPKSILKPAATPMSTTKRITFGNSIVKDFDKQRNVMDLQKRDTTVERILFDGDNAQAQHATAQNETVATDATISVEKAEDDIQEGSPAKMRKLDTPIRNAIQAAAHAKTAAQAAIAKLATPVRSELVAEAANRKGKISAIVEDMQRAKKNKVRTPVRNELVSMAAAYAARCEERQVEVDENHRVQTPMRKELQAAAVSHADRASHSALPAKDLTIPTPLKSEMKSKSGAVAEAAAQKVIEGGNKKRAVMTPLKKDIRTGAIDMARRLHDRAEDMSVSNPTLTAVKNELVSKAAEITAVVAEKKNELEIATKVPVELKKEVTVAAAHKVAELSQRREEMQTAASATLQIKSELTAVAGKVMAVVEERRVELISAPKVSTPMKKQIATVASCVQSAVEARKAELENAPKVATPMRKELKEVAKELMTGIETRKQELLSAPKVATPLRKELTKSAALTMASIEARKHELAVAPKVDSSLKTELQGKASVVEQRVAKRVNDLVEHAIFSPLKRQIRKGVELRSIPVPASIGECVGTAVDNKQEEQSVLVEAPVRSITIESAHDGQSAADNEETSADEQCVTKVREDETVQDNLHVDLLPQAPTETQETASAASNVEGVRMHTEVEAADVGNVVVLQVEESKEESSVAAPRSSRKRACMSTETTVSETIVSPKPTRKSRKVVEQQPVACELQVESKVETPRPTRSSRRATKEEAVPLIIDVPEVAPAVESVTSSRSSGRRAAATRKRPLPTAEEGVTESSSAEDTVVAPIEIAVASSEANAPKRGRRAAAAKVPESAPVESVVSLPVPESDAATNVAASRTRRTRAAKAEVEAVAVVAEQVAPVVEDDSASAAKKTTRRSTRSTAVEAPVEPEVVEEQAPVRRSTRARK